MNIHTAAAQFKLTDSTVRVRSTGETGSYWGCDAVPPTSVTLIVLRGSERTLVDFPVEDLEVLAD
jgi:hypothetical protein